MTTQKSTTLQNVESFAKPQMVKLIVTYLGDNKNYWCDLKYSKNSIECIQCEDDRFQSFIKKHNDKKKELEDIVDKLLTNPSINEYDMVCSKKGFLMHLYYYYKIKLSLDQKSSKIGQIDCFYVIL